MDVEENQTHPLKLSKVIGTSVAQPNKIVQSAVVEQQCREDDDEIRKVGIVVPSSNETVAKLCGWHHSSRIYRVSRASGGKDRHSKVLTSKGLRDRRVRLSVSTAIAFYDLQDRLGYDQPSKAVEWLIKAAEEAIAELPSLNCAFPDTPPKLLSDTKHTEHGVEMEIDDDYLDYQHRQRQQQHFLSKSARSSNSETSKGSGLSLSRPDIRVSRVKARERARDRAVKDKDKDKEMEINQYNAGNTNAHNSSFTELLTTGISGNSNNTSTGSGSAQQSPHREGRQWPPSAPTDYFTSGLFESARTHYHSNLGFLNHIQLGNSSLPQSMIIPPLTHHSSEQHHFSLQFQRAVVENYNLNFTMSSSSGLAGLNRGTLQSNSGVPSLFPHLQRFSQTDDSSSVPFFIGANATTPSAAVPLENNNHHHHYHQFASESEGPLQLYHGDGTRFSNNDGKGKH